MIKYNELVNGLKRLGGDFLDQLTPEDILHVHNLIGVLQPPKWHPEGCAYTHTKLVIDQGLRLGANHAELFGCLAHDLGKSLTPQEKWPHHYEHESAGVPLVHELCDKVDAPNEVRELAWRCSKYHLLVHRFDDLKTRTRVRLIRNLGHHLKSVALVSQADAQGRGPEFVNKPYPSRVSLYLAAAALKAFDMSYEANPEKWMQSATRHMDDIGLGKKKQK